MQCISHYASPLGEILLTADDVGLTGLWLPEQKHPAPCGENRGNFGILQAKKWLDAYFAGKVPEVTVPLHFIGTDFQKCVWNLLRAIPYGETVTYGQLAKQLAPNMSAQAVGGAVGRNNISIIVPCHRVLGAGGTLTGYAGGLDKKKFLLSLEGINYKGEV